MFLTTYEPQFYLSDIRSAACPDKWHEPVSQYEHNDVEYKNIL